MNNRPKKIFCVIDGTLWNHPGNYGTINPYTIYRMEGIEDSLYLESSTNELWDVIRLDDKYKRENTKEKDYL